MRLFETVEDARKAREGLLSMCRAKLCRMERLLDEDSEEMHALVDFCHAFDLLVESFDAEREAVEAEADDRDLFNYHRIRVLEGKEPPFTVEERMEKAKEAGDDA